MATNELARKPKSRPVPMQLCIGTGDVLLSVHVALAAA
jgi:hypothetical protein